MLATRTGGEFGPGARDGVGTRQRPSEDIAVVGQQSTADGAFRVHPIPRVAVVRHQIPQIAAIPSVVTTVKISCSGAPTLKKSLNL